MAKRKELAGNLIGNLIVLNYSHTEKAGKNNARAIWNVKCLCGNIFKCSSYRLNGKVKNCTVCAYTANGMKLRKNDVLVCLRRFYRRYKGTARRRGIPFTLEWAEFCKLVKNNCYYCNEAPTNTVKSEYRDLKTFYNGLDRVDNEMGYSSDNVVTCCTTCNNMKMALLQKSFYKHVLKIVAHRNLI